MHIRDVLGQNVNFIFEYFEVIKTQISTDLELRLLFVVAEVFLLFKFIFGLPYDTETFPSLQS